MFSQTYIDDLFVWQAKRMPITILSTLYTTEGSVQKTIYAILLMVAAVGAATETLTAQPVNLGTCHRLPAAREDFADEE